MKSKNKNSTKSTLILLLFLNVTNLFGKTYYSCKEYNDTPILIGEIPLSIFFDTHTFHKIKKIKEPHGFTNYVPLSLTIDSKGRVIIPNRPDKTISFYIKKNLLQVLEKEQELSVNMSIEAIDIYCDSCFLASSWNEDSLNLLCRNSYKKIDRHIGNKIVLSPTGDNFAYIKDFRLYDYKKYFPYGVCEYHEDYHPNDFHMVSDSSIIVCELNDDYCFKIDLYNSGAISEKSILVCNDSFDFSYIDKISILNVRKNILTMLVTDSYHENTFTIFKVNVGNGDIMKIKEIDISSLVSKNKILIGEGAGIWPNGVVQYYNEINDDLYLMFTTMDSINILKYKVQ